MLICGAVTLGDDGAFAGMTSGAIFVDNTTTSADVAVELHAVAAAGGGFVDVPVSGGQAGAEGGILTVMCGGDETTYAKAEPVIASFGKSVRRIGGPGAGQRGKMVSRDLYWWACAGAFGSAQFRPARGLIWKRCWRQSPAARR